MSREVIWHELECHGYTADLPVWRELAVSPVLDVGAGTGRVAADLAERGHDVTALDVDPELLDELSRRVPGVRTVRADARSFDLGTRFATILVPMQTIQLLDDRPGFLRCARRHLAPGGTLAMAIAEEVEPFDGAVLPAPDVAERDGWRYASQPVRIAPHGAAMRVERVRSWWGPDGRRSLEAAAVDLARVDVATLEAEAADAGFTPADRIELAATDEHIASVVVVVRG